MPTKIVQEIPATEHQQHQHQQRHAPQSDAEGDVATTVAEASPSMPTTLKLSFGNVDFSLVPTSSNGTVTFQANGLNEAVLNLNNFSGSLVIACNTANLVNRSSNNNNSSSCCNNNLVEDAASPSPDATSKQKKKTKVRTSAAAGQQQLTSWATCRKTGFSSQAPTPKMTNNDNSCKKNNNNTKRSSSQIEQIVQANRSSPSLQPYHSPVKRSRQVHGIPTPLATHLPPSPILLAQKTTHSYSKELDCSQTMSSQPTSQEEEEENEEDRLVSKQHPSFTDEDSVATHNADDDNVDVDMMDINNKMISSSSSSSSIKPMMADPSSQPSGSTTQDEVSTAFENTKTQTNISTVMKTPDPRWGHTLTAIDHGRLLLCGGQSFQPVTKGKGKNATTEILPVTMSDVHVFEMERNKWFQPISCDDKSQQWPRQWHSATFLPQRQLLICFGGEAMNPTTGRITTSDKNNLMVLDTEILLWYPPSASGDLPSGRSGHTATLLENNNELVIFGGSKSNKFLNSVSVLDTTSWIWTTPKIQGVAPKARSYHSATAVKPMTTKAEGSDADATHVRQRIVIFGGNDQDVSFATVHVLEKMDTPKEEATWKWFHPTVSGTVPSARTGHSATLMNDGKTICIYGGWDPNQDDDESNQDDGWYGDSFLLDTETWTWKRSDSVPVFMGHSLNASQGTNGGPARAGHGAVLNSFTNGSGNSKGARASNEILIFGGRTAEGFEGDFQSMTVSES